jgi:hypothetical protein
MPLVPLFRRTGRLRVTPDDPEGVPTAPRGKSSRRPHADAKVTPR